MGKIEGMGKVMHFIINPKVETNYIIIDNGLFHLPFLTLSKPYFIIGFCKVHIVGDGVASFSAMSFRTHDTDINTITNNNIHKGCKFSPTT